jgi:hypothetical protein
MSKDTEAFTDTGGARIGEWFNATYPLATLSGDASGLHLMCPGHDYHFPRRTIHRLRRHRGFMSVGLQIEHTQEAVPEFIVFWASVFFWTRGFQKLKKELERLGYEVAA